MKIVTGCLVLLLAAVVTPLTQEQEHILEPYSKACKLETGITDDLIQKARKGEFEGDNRIKLQILCVMKKIGFVNQAGEPVVKKFKEAIKNFGVDDKEANRLVEKCVGDTIFKISKCLLKTKPNWSVQ